jgi:hypothetical protein
MRIKKDESERNKKGESPKEPRIIIPGDSDSGRRNRGILGELHGDVRKGQKPGKLED